MLPFLVESDHFSPYVDDIDSRRILSFQVEAWAARLFFGGFSVLSPYVIVFYCLQFGGIALSEKGILRHSVQRKLNNGLILNKKNTKNRIMKRIKT